MFLIRNYYKGMTGNNLSRQSMQRQADEEYYSEVYRQPQQPQQPQRSPQPQQSQQPSYAKDEVPPVEQYQDDDQGQNSDDSFQMNQHNYSSSNESVNKPNHSDIDNQGH